VGYVGGCAKEYGPNPRERTVLFVAPMLIVNHINNIKLHQSEHILDDLCRECVKILPIALFEAPKAVSIHA